MTLLASWAAIDTHGISSAYIVSDSRISWGNKKYFDFGKKVFASKKYPEIFGYAGDVLFPSIVLSQIIDMIDTDVLFDESMTCSKKNKIVFEKLQYSFSKYPDVYGDNPIQIIHISRDTMVDKYPNFHHYLLTWNRKYGWSKEEKVFPIKSGILNVLGSGKEEFKKNYNERYQSCINKSTSRNVFHCFIDTLYNIQDTMCGGPPQLVGIYRKPNTAAQNFGIVYNQKRFLLGMEVPNESVYNKVEWRNENFELCDGTLKKKLQNASSQKNLMRRN